MNAATPTRTVVPIDTPLEARVRHCRAAIAWLSNSGEFYGRIGQEDMARQMRQSATAKAIELNRLIHPVAIPTYPG